MTARLLLFTMSSPRASNCFLCAGKDYALLESLLAGEAGWAEPMTRDRHGDRMCRTSPPSPNTMARSPYTNERRRRSKGGTSDGHRTFPGTASGDGLAGHGAPGGFLPPGGGMAEAELPGSGVFSELPPRSAGAGIPLPVSPCFGGRFPYLELS